MFRLLKDAPKFDRNIANEAQPSNTADIASTLYGADRHDRNADQDTGM
jgi:hypothetical protein